MDDERPAPKEKGRFLKLDLNEGIQIKTKSRITADVESVAPEAAQASIPDESVALHLLDDRPLEDDAQDQLGFKPYADALTSLIDNHRTRTPLTIAVNAPWGAGKSSLGGMVERRLDSQNADGGHHPHVTCTFNAWMHDGAENITSALVSEVVRTADRHRKPAQRVFRALPGALLNPRDRIRRRAMLTGAYSVFVALLALLAHGVATGGEVDLDSALTVISDAPDAGSTGDEERRTQNIVGFLQNPFAWSPALLVSLATVLRSGIPTAQSLRAYLHGPSEEAERGTNNAVRDDLDAFLETSLPEGSRLVLFIDDLDRCRPENSIALLDFTNQFMTLDRVVIVLLADMDTVADHAGQAHADRRGDDTAAVSYGRRYLRKLVQLQFDLPRQRPGSIHDLAVHWALPPKTQAEAPDGDENGTQAPAARPEHSGRVPAWKEPWLQARGLAGASTSIPRHILSVLVSPVTYAIKAFEDSRRGARALAAGPALRRDLPPGPGLASAMWLFLGAGAAFFGVLFSMDFLVSLFGVDYWWDTGSLVSIADGFALTWFWWALSFWAFLPVAFLLGLMEGVRYRAEAEDAESAAEPNPSRKPEDIPAPLQERREAGARRRRYTRLVDDSGPVQLALGSIRRHLPAQPRSAKRLLNNLRLQMFILDELGLMKPKGTVSAPQLGKWSVLVERWPEVGRKVRNRPEALAMLELGARADSGTDAKDAWSQACATWLEGLEVESGLREFLADGETMAPAADALLRYENESPQQVEVTV